MNSLPEKLFFFLLLTIATYIFRYTDLSFSSTITSYLYNIYKRKHLRVLSYFANTPYKLLVNRYLYICSSQIHFFSRRETNSRGTNRSLISFKYRILCSSRKRTRIGLQCLSSQVEEIFHTPLRAGISITIDQFQHSLRHRSHRISSFSERKYFDISLFWSTSWWKIDLKINRFDVV